LSNNESGAILVPVVSAENGPNAAVSRFTVAPNIFKSDAFEGDQLPLSFPSNVWAMKPMSPILAMKPMSPILVMAELVTEWIATVNPETQPRLGRRTGQTG
jgi:hypothetical protein